MPVSPLLRLKMLRPIAAVGLIIAVALLVVFGPRYLVDSDGSATYSECNLLQEPCVWSTPEGDWQASLTPGELGTQGQVYRLAITSPQAPDRFLAVLRGESMYMGEYPIPLRQQSASDFTAEFTAPFCTTGGEMVWRVDLQSGQEKLGNVPLTLVFRAQK